MSYFPVPKLKVITLRLHIVLHAKCNVQVPSLNFLCKCRNTVNRVVSRVCVNDVGRGRDHDGLEAYIFIHLYFLNKRYLCTEVTLTLIPHIERLNLILFPHQIMNIHEDKQWARIKKDLEYLTHWTFGTDSFYLEVFSLFINIYTKLLEYSNIT